MGWVHDSSAKLAPMPSVRSPTRVLAGITTDREGPNGPQASGAPRQAVADRRKLRGLVPKHFLNSVEKCAELVKPHSKAISVMLRSTSAADDSSRRAAWSRQTFRYSEGVSPSDARAICTYRGVISRWFAMSSVERPGFA